MKLNSSLLLIPAMLGLGLSTSKAATILTYTAQPAGQVVSQSAGNYTIGSRILVNTAGLSITNLGVMDTTGSGTIGSDGFVAAGNVSVGIWTVGGTLLAQATVGDTDTLIGGYRYSSVLKDASNQTIASLSLTAGQQYLIGAYVGGGVEWWLEDNTLNTGPDAGTPEMISASSGDITLLNNQYATGFAAPTTNGGGTGAGRWGAANAILVPEPSAALLGGLGMLALLRRRRH